MDLTKFLADQKRRRSPGKLGQKAGSFSSMQALAERWSREDLEAHYPKAVAAFILAAIAFIVVDATVHIVDLNIGSFFEDIFRSAPGVLLERVIFGSIVGAAAGVFVTTWAARKGSMDSVREMARLIDKNPCSIIITDTEGVIQYVNERFSSITGYAPEECLGQTPRLLKSGDMSPMNYSILWKTITSGGEWSGILHNKKKNGELYWETCSISPMLDREGHVRFFIAVKEDITQFKKTEEKLLENEEKFRKLYDESPDPMLTLSPDLRIIASNNSMARMSGYSTGELFGMPLGTLDPTVARPEVGIELAERLCSGESLLPFERTIRTKDGRSVDVEIHASSVSFNGVGGSAIQAVLRDITGRKKAEEKIRLTQFAVDQSAESSFWVDSAGRIRYVNEAACKALGYSKADLESMFVADIDPDFPKDAWPKHWEEMKTKRTMIFESQHKKKSGAVFPVEIQTTYFQQGEDEFIWAYARDISERKEAEERVRFTQFAVDHNADGTFCVREDGAIRYANAAASRDLGYTRKELEKMTVLDIAPDFTPELWAQHWGEMKAKTAMTLETRHKRKSGQVFPVEIHASFFKHLHEEYIWAYARDISERKQTERDLLGAGENERMRIGQDLHDGLGQRLAGITLLAKALQNQLELPICGFKVGCASAKVAGQIVKEVENAMNRTRALAQELVPMELSQRGFAEALEVLADETTRISGIACVVENPSRIEVSNVTAASHLFRIAQECVSNAIKHSNADKIKILLRGEDDFVELRVEDNGEGMKKGRPDGLGARLLKYRAAALGGAFHRGNNKSGGVIASCVVAKDILTVEKEKK